MFHSTPFDEDISAWDVSSVTDMYGMFHDCPILEDHKHVMFNR